MASEKLFSGDDLLTLSADDGERYELIEGQLFKMAPAGGEHGMVAGALTVELGYYIKRNDLGVVLAAETGYYTRGDNYTVRAPDFSFIRREKLAEATTLKPFLHIVPDIVAEVVSPNDSAIKVEQKIHEWLDFGVTQVWVLYPDTKRIYIYTGNDPRPHVYDVDDVIVMDTVLPGLQLAVADVFSF